MPAPQQNGAWTRGPWSLSPFCDRDPRIWVYGMSPDGANRPSIATVRFGLDCGNDIARETQANAHLIAAAPCLASAGEVALTVLDAVYKEWDGEPEDMVPVQEARALLRGALARARGELR